MRFLRLLSLIGLSLFASPAFAQTIVSQDSTLTGLKRVFVKFEVYEGSLDQRTASEMQDAITLELRKAGLRVAKAVEEIDPDQDGVIYVQFAKVSRSLSNDAIFRLDVRQAARLERTKKPSFMVTWFYEDNGRNVIVPEFASAAAKKGVNQFLTAWLDVNGR